MMLAYLGCTFINLLCCRIVAACLVRPVPPGPAVPTCLQELKESSRNKEATGIELIPDESNVFLWRAVIKVPKLFCPYAKLGLQQHRVGFPCWRTLGCPGCAPVFCLLNSILWIVCCRAP